MWFIYLMAQSLSTLAARNSLICGWEHHRPLPSRPPTLHLRSTSPTQAQRANPRCYRRTQQIIGRAKTYVKLVAAPVHFKRECSVYPVCVLPPGYLPGYLPVCMSACLRVCLSDCNFNMYAHSIHLKPPPTSDSEHRLTTTRVKSFNLLKTLATEI